MNSNNNPIKTTVLDRNAIDEILCNRNLDFLIAFKNNGEIERFVPEGGCCDFAPVEFPIPVEQIEEIQQFHITTLKVKPKMVGALTCIKYCTYDGVTYCCKYP